MLKPTFDKIKIAVIGTAIFIFLILIDQALKYYFFLKNPLLPCNGNLSLGLEIKNGFFWPVWLIFILLLIYIQKNYLKNDTWSYFFGIIILAGTISNALDRLIISCVRDFIPFIKNLFFFNLADVFIFIGVSWIILLFFKKS